MLVLTRKSNQKIHIGNDVVITILRVKAGFVKIGIDAPKELSIARDEVLDTTLGNPKFDDPK